MYAWWYYNFVEPWIYGEWMMRAVSISIFVSVACALLGCWLYLRRLSMFADALAHIVVPGIAVGFMVTGSRDSAPMLLGAIAAGVLAAFLIGFITRRTRVKEDASIGVVYTALFALGVILLSVVARKVHLDADCVLFGNVLGVPDGALWLMAGVCVAVMVATVLFYKQLLVSSFDPAFAAAIGLPVATIHYLLMSVLSVTAVASFEAVGAILVVALLIAPAATAHLLTDRMVPMLLLAAAQGLISAVFGIYVAVWFDTNPAGSMVLVSCGLYVVALFLSPRHGILARHLARAARRKRHIAATQG